MDKPKEMKWTDDSTCDFCKEDCRDVGTFFVDGKTKLGPWALMCEKDWKKQGYPKLGTGWGQRYDSVSLRKIEG